MFLFNSSSPYLRLTFGGCGGFCIVAAVLKSEMISMFSTAVLGETLKLWFFFILQNFWPAGYFDKEFVPHLCHSVPPPPPLLKVWISISFSRFLGERCQWYHRWHLGETVRDDWNPPSRPDKKFVFIFAFEFVLFICALAYLYSSQVELVAGVSLLVGGRTLPLREDRSLCPQSTCHLVCCSSCPPWGGCLSDLVKRETSLSFSKIWSVRNTFCKS